MNKLTISLTAVGATLLVAVVALAFLFIGQSTRTTIDASQETTSGTDTTQSPVEPVSGTGGQPVVQQPASNNGGNGNGGGNSAPAPAVDDSLRFISFGADLQVFCDSNADEKAQPQISWSAANAVAVYWTPSNQEATADNGYLVGSSGTQYEMSVSKGPGERYEFPCNHRQYFDTTITIYGADGQKVSKHVTFTDVNWGLDLGSDDDD